MKKKRLQIKLYAIQTQCFSSLLARQFPNMNEMTGNIIIYAEKVQCAVDSVLRQQQQPLACEGGEPYCVAGAEVFYPSLRMYFKCFEDETCIRSDHFNHPM